MKIRYIIILFPLLLLFIIPLDTIISQVNQYDTSGWIDVFEPTVKASFKRPAKWKKREDGSGKGIYFNPDQPMFDDQGRSITPMIGVSNVEDPKDVEIYLKSINSGQFEKMSTKNYDYYVAIINWKNRQQMYIYIEVEKGKRYLGCSLVPYSSDPSSKNFEVQLRAMVETFKFNKSTNSEKKTDDKIQLNGHWKVD